MFSSSNSGSNVAAAAAAAASRALDQPASSLKSLALSVHFRKPSLGMKDYEILSRATAFLLAVDPPNDVKDIEKEGRYGHLKQAAEDRAELLRAQHFQHQRAGGPRRRAKDLGWLEFCPTKHRPIVHCVASSHVLAPWKWPQYYPQDWLQQVKQEDW